MAIRLGPALLGMRVFLGLDVLDIFAPWSASPDASWPRTSVFVSDQIDGYVPAVKEIAERFHHGDLASWSSLIGGGTPLLGTPDFALFTPGRWLYLVLPIWLAPGWSKLVELGFAALFSYLLVRRLSGSRVAAGVAGFVYPLTGFMIGWTNWPQAAVGTAIPMLFWAVERFLQERRLRAAIPISLASALLVLGGFPAVAGHAFIVVGGYALVRCVALHPKRVRQAFRDLVVAFAAVALGFGLAAFQLLPFVYRVIGGTDLSYREGGFFSHTPHNYLLTSVFPQSFAGNDVPTGSGSPMDLNSYVGSVVVLLAAIGVLAAVTGFIQREVGLYLAAVVVLVIGLIWFQGPWSDWIDHLPLFHGNPVGRIRAQLGIPAAVLAAAGVDVLRGQSWSGAATARRRVGRAAPVLIAIVATALVCGVGVAFATNRAFPLPGQRWPDVLLAGVPLLVITLLLVIGVRHTAGRQAALAVAIVAIAAQALSATAFYWPTADRSAFYPTSGGVRYLQEHLGHERIATMGYALRPNVNEVYGLRSITAHTFYPKRLTSLLKTIDPGVFRGPTYTELGSAPGSWLDADGLDRLGVRYLVADDNAPYPGTHSLPIALPGDLDPLPPPARTMMLTPGQVYSDTIPAGPLRGVSIPLTLSTDTAVTVSLKDADGWTIAENSVRFSPGAWDVPVPLAAESVAPTSSIPSSTAVTIEASVDEPGALGSVDAAGTLRMQAVRSPKESDNARLVYAGEDLIIWERLGSLPRIRWADDATVIENDAARLSEAGRGVLETDGVILARQPEVPLPRGNGSPSQFEVVRDTGDEIVVDVTTGEPGFVVVADNVQTDFVAEVDGEHTPIVEADYAFGAVYVPAGRHSVALHYSPRGGTLGSTVSLGSAAVLVSAAVPIAWSLDLRRRRRERTDTSPDRTGLTA